MAAEAERQSPLYTGLRVAVLALRAPAPEEFLEHLPASYREPRIRILTRLIHPTPDRRGRGVSVVFCLCRQLAPP